eukprot:scaffold40961_cov28-Tisochrysis_lutea.AAC.1
MLCAHTMHDPFYVQTMHHSGGKHRIAARQGKRKHQGMSELLCGLKVLKAEGTKETVGAESRRV